MIVASFVSMLFIFSAALAASAVKLHRFFAIGLLVADALYRARTVFGRLDMITSESASRAGRRGKLLRQTSEIRR